MTPTSRQTIVLEEEIEHWRSYLHRRKADPSVVEQLEGQLRTQVASLLSAGLATDEAFLVAVKRMGSQDALSREFARAQSTRLWKQVLPEPADSGESHRPGQTDLVIALCLAVAAAAAIKLPALFGLRLDEQIDEDVRFYLRNASLLVLPLLTIYFAWKRRLQSTTLRWLAVGFAAAAAFANCYPFARASSTEVLMGVHLPIALWLLVGMAYAGGRWSQVESRMDFIRFTGELFIYYVLIALGGGVLTAFMGMIFKAIGINVGPFIGAWVLPCGAAGAVLVASWLVEAKQSVLENMAPMLTRLFTPMFAVMLLIFLGALLWTGRGVDVTRDVLIAFDLLLVVVIGLLLYAASARDPRSPATPSMLSRSCWWSARSWPTG
ncbi:MAG: permease prefix domain 1-containing protein [Verrucomicrobiota bacterium]